MLCIREGYTIQIARDKFLVRKSFQFMAFPLAFISKQIFFRVVCLETEEEILYSGTLF